MTLTKDIKDMAIHMGVDLVGVSPVERFQHAPAKFQPQYHMRDAKNVVVFASRILEGICDAHGA